MALTPWRILRSTYALESEWITIRADRCATGTGSIVDPYYVQEGSDWVQVVPFDAEDRILVIRQYRHAAREIVLEFPCGRVERGESPEAAVMRELREETGCTVETLQKVGAASPNPARYALTVHTYYTLGTSLSDAQQLDENEEIECQFVSVEALLQMVDRQQFRNPLALSALFLALRARNLLGGCELP